MRHALSFLVLAALGRLCACGSGTVRPAMPSDPPPIGTSSWTFDDHPPPLPKDIGCLQYPMLGYRDVSSRFKDPRHKFTPGKHGGVDFPAPVGTAVLAPAAGKVTKIVPVESPAEAAIVYVRFADGWTFGVVHLSRIDVAVGEKVLRGQRLGLSGAKPGDPGAGLYTTGPHLHFTLIHGDDFVDPMPFLCPVT